MGKLLPVPYPGQSMDEYREQLVNFQKNYWSFLKPSKGGSKFIPLPPLTLIKKTKEMSSRKLSEHVEEELFNKEKRVIPNVPPEYRVKLNEGVDPKKVIKTKPVIRKESILGSVPTPKTKKDSKDFLSEESKTNIVKTITNSGEYSAPVKKKKTYYRKKYNKPKPVEVIIPEPIKSDNSIKAFTIGLIFGIVATIIVINLIK
jgi:hypothetical protein